ncbi:MAG: hypothetical protein IJD86_07190 [Clostridia bacterium]|nr:hypothetical protein [Clostridia bacterium]
MLIRQAAFEPFDKPLLKGGLHCHTTRSDGRTEPDETIRNFRAHGYDFLSLTDHRRYNYENFAEDSGLLIVPGMELDANLLPDSNKGMCFHVVAIGPDDDTNGYKQDERFESVRVNDQSEYQAHVDNILKNNNLAIYCHPEWSCTPARSFEKLSGFFAFEVMNYGCVVTDALDVDNGYVWDELLMQGKKIFGVATDDCHALYQQCGGWVRVRAEKNVKSILEALKAGAFYASGGPEIYDFTYEDGIARISCSPCEYIKFFIGSRPTRMQKREDGMISEAEFKIDSSARYVRAVCVDGEGNIAWTNPIFLENF